MSTAVIDQQELRKAVHEKIDILLKQFYEKVPFARYQAETKELNLDYYKRHCNETILRMYLKRTADAMIIKHFTKTDPKAAKMWAQYTEEEMLHHYLFANDLEQFGLTKEQIYAQDPFLATKLLQGYFYYTLEHEGPLAALVSSYFLEYTTRKTQPVWLDNLSKLIGEKAIHGARTHVSYDIKEDHTAFVWNVIMTLIKSDKDQEKLFYHIDAISGLFSAYFVELYNSTLGCTEGASPLLSVPGAAVIYAAV
jgi:hypothetical protein